MCTIRKPRRHQLETRRIKGSARDRSWARARLRPWSWKTFRCSQAPELDIFKNNVRASYFTTIYVDAFAGTGNRVESAGRRGKAAAGTLEDDDDSDAESLQKGSARIALEVDPPFDRFLFIERSAKRVKALQKLRSEFPDRASVIQIEQGDANDLLKQSC